MTRSALAAIPPPPTAPAKPERAKPDHRAKPGPVNVPATLGRTDRPIGYFEASGYPLTSLMFVIPLMVAYEVGTRWYASDPVSHVQQRIVAFTLMQQFFAQLNLSGQYLPAATVTSVLVFWHLARADVWAARSTVLLCMAAESAMYAIPLVALGFAFQHYLPPAPRLAAPHLFAPHLFGLPLVGPPASGSPRAMLVLSIGAGVYEELIFRLVSFTVLNILFTNVLRMPRVTAVPLMVLLSAVAFSLYHYPPTGLEPFHWESFAFRAAAGVYFGVIFACRGFGLTAGSHAAYDVFIVMLQASATV